jgi:hypothetical protein
MLIYNVTYLVPEEISEKWLMWMKVDHIPKIMETNLFEKNTLLQLINVDEQDGITFAFQLFILSELEFNEYEKIFAPDLHLNSKKAWGEQILSFSTLMRIVQ